MNGITINIVPVKSVVTTKVGNNDPVITETIISSVEIGVERLILNTSVNVRMIQKTETGNINNMQFVDIVGVDYSNWGNNDDYLITFMLNKFGFTQKV
jgi:hypothetical protein